MTPGIVSSLEPLIPALRRYAHALLRDSWDADDLVQDCLERAVGRWHQRREDASTRAWLFSILHNLAMTRLQRAARQPRFVPLDESAPVAVRATQEDPLHCQDVLHALALLPDEQRSVLLLVAVEDLSYVEAARVLGVPVGTVMSRLSRARERLHQRLSDEVGPQSSRTPCRLVKIVNNGS